MCLAVCIRMNLCASPAMFHGRSGWRAVASNPLAGFRPWRAFIPDAYGPIP